MQVVVRLDGGPGSVHYCWLVGDYKLEFQWQARGSALLNIYT